MTFSRCITGIYGKTSEDYTLRYHYYLLVFRWLAKEVSIDVKVRYAGSCDIVNCMNGSLLVHCSNILYTWKNIPTISLYLGGAKFNSPPNSIAEIMLGQQGSISI
jgi:hypothetical protein